MYPPREDSQLLLDAALRELEPEDRVLEVGVGSGYVAGNLLEAASLVVGTDVNPTAAQRARDRGVEALRSHLASAVCGEFDLVVFNPPYLPDREDASDDAMDAALSGGESGVEVAAELVDDLSRLLADEGRALVVASSLADVDSLESHAIDRGFEVDEAARDSFFFEEIAVLRLRLAE